MLGFAVLRDRLGVSPSWFRVSEASGPLGAAIHGRDRLPHCWSTCAAVGLEEQDQQPHPPRRARLPDRRSTMDIMDPPFPWWIERWGGTDAGRWAMRNGERATLKIAWRILGHWADLWAHLTMAYVARRRRLYRGAALRERSRRLSGPSVSDRESALGDRAGGGRRRNSDAVMRGVMWVARWLPCGKSPMRP